MINLFSENPLLLLFTVAAVGYLLGNIKIGTNRLGVAAVLFVGLAFGAIDTRLDIPEIIFMLGLSMYVYSIGISSGPAFFASYKKNGLADFAFILAMLIFSGIVAVVLSLLFGFSAGAITGMYAGSTTNTPAMAGVIDYINNSALNDKSSITESLVIGYSFSYPMGVLGGMIAIALSQKWLKIDFHKEKKELRGQYPLGDDLTSRTVLITNPEIAGVALRDLHNTYDWNVVFGRMTKGSSGISLANWDANFDLGDRVMIAGSREDLDTVEEILGERDDAKLSYDRSTYDVKQIFVSNTKLVGRTLASLELDKKYNCIISRIRKGDMEMLAKGDTTLELGDRIRFVARRQDLKALSAYFGDSYAASAKVNLFSFGLGIGIGLLLGNIDISLGQISFKLGYAGGPLIAGLLLGSLRRTGPIVWTLPYSANVTLQQIGLILLLATIGVRSGHSFISTISIEGLWMFLGAAVISLCTAFFTLIFGYKIVKKPFSLLMGIVSNQPAILDFALSKSGNRLPMIGYTMMFPLALISKVVIAQILFLLLV